MLSNQLRHIGTRSLCYLNQTYMTATHSQRLSAEKWDALLKSLNQTIVNNLRLKEPNRRHLIEWYDFCLSDNPAIVRNRSSAIGAFPLIRFVLTENRHQKQPTNNRNIFTLFQQVFAYKKTYGDRIDEGESIEVLQDYLTKKYVNPDSISHCLWVTPLLMKRMKLAESLDDVAKIGSLLAYHSLDKKNQFCPQIYHKALRNLPCSIKDPEKFVRMMQYANHCSHLFGSGKAAFNLFMNAKTWSDESFPLTLEKDKKRAAQDGIYRFWRGSDVIHRYIKEISADLFVPAYYDALEKEYASKNEAVPAHLKSYEHFHYILNEMVIIAQNIITPALNLKTLQSLANHFYKNKSSLDIEKPLFKKLFQIDAPVYQFLPLLDTKNITMNGFEYTFISNSEHLSQIAEELSNCALNFAKKCIEKDVYLIYGKSPAGEVFLVAVEKTPHQTFLMDEISGFYNDDVSDEVQNEAQHFIDQINVGKISITGHDSVDEKTVTQTLGFDPLLEAEEIFNLYQKNKFLPNRFLNCTLIEFLENAGFNHALREFLMVYPELLRPESAQSKDCEYFYFK